MFGASYVNWGHCVVQMGTAEVMLGGGGGV